MNRQSLRHLVFLLGLVSVPVSVGPLEAQGLAVALEPTAAGLSRPLAVADPGAGGRRLFIVEQTGRIRVSRGGQLLPTPFLDLTALVSCCGERGLLALAFHPDYPTNGHFFVGYTDLGGDTVIARYTVSASDPDVADPLSAVVVLKEDQPAGNHNNGQLAFGPDGFLYLALGDGGASAARGQDLTSLLGKILRIDPDGDDFPAEPNRNYAIPAGNPFVGNANARDEIWAYGLRNPWRFSFDRLTGDLWIGDVGAGALEEIDLAPGTSLGGENYGWPIMEGSSCLNPPTGCNDGSLTLPVLEYDHGFGCAVTGGYRYRGAREPGLRGVYIYGDFCFGTIWGTVPRCDGAWESQVLLESGLSISSFGEDRAGEIYVADLFGGNEALYRLERAGSGGPALTGTPPALGFGTPPPGSLSTLALTLANPNTGPEAVTIDSLAPSDTVSFSLDLAAGASPCGPTPICLSPGSSCTLEVDFTSLGGSFDERLLADGNFDAIDLPLTAAVACGGPDHLLVTGTAFAEGVELVGCQTVVLGAGVVFEAGANAAVRAGSSVELENGVSILPGARVRLGTDPSLAE